MNFLNYLCYYYYYYYYPTQHLHASTLNAFNIKASEDLCSLILPFYSFKNTLVAVKILTVETISDDLSIGLDTNLITDQSISVIKKDCSDVGLKVDPSSGTHPLSTKSFVESCDEVDDSKPNDNVEKIERLNDKEVQPTELAGSGQKLTENTFKECKPDDTADNLSQNTEEVTDKGNYDVEDSIEDVVRKTIVKTTVIPRL